MSKIISVIALAWLCVTAVQAATVQPELFIRTGDPAAGETGLHHGGLGTPQVNNNGHLVFSNSLSGPGTNSGNSRALYSSDGQVFRQGDPVPGIPGATFRTFSQSALNNNNEFAFGALIEGPGVTADDNYVLFGSGGVIVRKGDEAVGTAGATYAFIDSVGVPVMLNDTGQTAWTGTISGGDATASNNTGLFSPEGPVRRSGDPVPQIPGWVDGSAGDPVMNNDGDFAYVLRNGRRSEYAIVKSDGVVAKTGDAVDGRPGVTYSFFPSGNSKHLHLNNLGAVSYTAILSGTGIGSLNDKALFIDNMLVAQESDLVSGHSDLFFDSFFIPVVSDTGSMIFTGLLRGLGETSFSSRGLFYRTETGALEMLLRSGDLIDSGGGAFETVSNFNYLDGISDNGRFLAFSVSYKEGGSGIYTVDLAKISAVPLPAGLPLLASGIALFGFVRQRRRRVGSTSKQLAYGDRLQFSQEIL